MHKSIMPCAVRCSASSSYRAWTWLRQAEAAVGEPGQGCRLIKSNPEMRCSAKMQCTLLLNQGHQKAFKPQCSAKHSMGVTLPRGIG